MKSSILKTAFSFIAAGSVLLAQQAPSQGGWQRVGEGGTGKAASTSSTPTTGSDAAPAQQEPPAPAEAPVPAQLTLKPGTFISVRVNQLLSSDRNQQGDAFTATLDRPIVVDGFVVAQPGQTLAGRVSEAQKAGRVKGVSHLGIQLTDLTAVDGQQFPLQSELVTRDGRTSTGRDAGAIAGTTGVGAAAGAIGAGGTGAAIGAGAGAAVGVIGVLLTRGQPTVIYPEQLLTFRIDSPVTISTERAPQAFRPVEPGDYNRPSPPRLQTRQAAPPRPAYYPYAYGYPYPYWGPYYGFGPGFYGGGVIIGGRFRR